MSDSKTTYQQQAYDHVKTQILNLGYKPGAYITDSQIAKELEISRTPVREAFHRLENEGLLTSEARRGWRVYTLSLEDIHEIFDIKHELEGMIAREAAKCEDDQLRQSLKDALDKMQAATQAGDANAWFDADVHLHDTLFEMVANDRAYRIITNLNDQWHRVRIGFAALQSRMIPSTKEHEAFIEAILRGDDEKAEQHMQVHIDNVRQDLERLLVNMVLPFVDEGV